MTTTKRCTDCGSDKPTSEFYRHAPSRDGLFPYCKACCLTRQRRSNPARAKAAADTTAAYWAKWSVIAEANAREQRNG